MDAQHGAGRPRRPAFFGPAALDTFVGAPDPALRVEAAHATAEALLRHGRDGDDKVAALRQATRWQSTYFHPPAGGTTPVPCAPPSP